MLNLERRKTVNFVRRYGIRTETFLSLARSFQTIQKASGAPFASHHLHVVRMCIESFRPSRGLMVFRMGRVSTRCKTPKHTTHNATPWPTELTEDSGRTTHEGSPLPLSFSSFSSPLASARSSLFLGKIKRRGEQRWWKDARVEKETENRERSHLTTVLLNAVEKELWEREREREKCTATARYGIGRKVPSKRT